MLFVAELFLYGCNFVRNIEWSGVTFWKVIQVLRQRRWIGVLSLGTNVIREVRELGVTGRCPDVCSICFLFPLCVEGGHDLQKMR